MGIRVGTVFTQCDSGIPGDLDSLYFPCIEEGADKLDQCIGIVQYFADATNETVRVHWVQMCGFHHNDGKPTLDIVECDKVWEIGQLS